MYTIFSKLYAHRVCTPDDITFLAHACSKRTILAVFLLQTYNASGRLWTRHFSASFCPSFNSSRIKTGERRNIGLDEPNRLVRLKRFSSSRRIMRLRNKDEQ